MLFKAICLIICSLFATGLTQAETIEVCGEPKQGELLLLKNENALKIVLKNDISGKKYLFNKGIALVALQRDTPQKLKFDTVFGADYATQYELEITPVKWDIQRINGVASAKVAPKAADWAEIKREQKDLNNAVTQYNVGNAWQQGFILPVKGKISGNFGNQRIFNGTPKNPHTGTDIAAPEGTPVVASGTGKVVLSGKNYFYTGNMVIIDHGQGLQTIYAHLKAATVKAGDKVKQGDVIGYVGKTGRATGAHLHWGASLNNVRFNPYSLLNINSKKCRFIVGKTKGEKLND